MTEFRVTYWRDLPSLVTARDAEHTAKAALDARFMVAIDEAAMRLGATDSDAYLEGWRQSEWEERDGSPEEVVEAVARGTRRGVRPDPRAGIARLVRHLTDATIRVRSHESRRQCWRPLPRGASSGQTAQTRSRARAATRPT